MLKPVPAAQIREGLRAGTRVLSHSHTFSLYPCTLCVRIYIYIYILYMYTVYAYYIGILYRYAVYVYMYAVYDVYVGADNR